MMARDVHSDGTAVMVKGQRSNVFQSECKIQDKVCKLIIDGDSFTNAISQTWCMLYLCLFGDFLHHAICNG